MKTVTINVDGISQGQWSTFILELNLFFVDKFLSSFSITDADKVEYALSL